MAADHVIPLSNLTATTDPTVTDDVSAGYAVGSLWVNISEDAGALTGHVYLCVDPSFGAAIWRQIHPGVYGGMHQQNIPTTITIGSAGVDVIVTGMSAMTANRFIFASSQLTAAVAGDYITRWSISFHMASASGQQTEGSLYVNTTRQDQTSAHRTIGTGSDTGNMGGGGIVTMAVTDTIEVRVKNNTSTVDIVIDHANMDLVKCGD